jgi:hypothetical protein
MRDLGAARAALLIIATAIIALAALSATVGSAEPAPEVLQGTSFSYRSIPAPALSRKTP